MRILKLSRTLKTPENILVKDSIRGNEIIAKNNFLTLFAYYEIKKLLNYSLSMSTFPHFGEIRQVFFFPPLFLRFPVNSHLNS